MGDAAATISHKPSKANELLGTTIFLTVWGTLFVSARVYTRIFQTKSFSWDDGFILLSCLAGWAGEVLIIVQVQHGLGTPSAQIRRVSDIIAIIKYSNFAIFCNGIAMASLKVGIGASLLRIRLGKGFNTIVWAAIILSCIVNLTVFGGCFAKCQPIQRIWDKSIPGKCWPPWGDLVTSYGQTSGNILTDLLCSLGPLYFLSKVKVSHYNKWALRGIFAIGLLATACAIAKCTQLPALAKATTDFTYDTVALDIWVVAELNAGLFAASLPPLKSTFEHLLVRWFHVRSGLTTPSESHTFASTGYAAHVYAPGSGKHHPHHKSASHGHSGGGGGGVFNFSRKHNSTVLPSRQHGDAYAMDRMDTHKSNNKKRRDPDAISTDEEEEDQKHILEEDEAKGGESMKTASEDEQVGSTRESNGNRAGWITKTVEYTVRDDRSVPDHR